MSVANRDPNPSKTRSAAQSIKALKPHIIALAQRWKANPNCSLGDALFCEMHFHEAFCKAIPDLLATLDQSDLPAFTLSLQNDAMGCLLDLSSFKPHPIVADVKLFTLPYHGDPDILVRLIEDHNAFATLTRSFRKYGLAHPRAHVALLRGAIPLENMPLTRADGIRHVAVLLANQFTQDPDIAKLCDFSEAELLTILGGARHALTADSEAAASAILVGVRVIEYDAHTPRPSDYFTKFESPGEASYCDSVDDDNPADAYDLEADPMLAGWHEAIQRLAPGIESALFQPVNWEEAISDLTYCTFTTALDTLKEAHELAADDRPDQIFITHTDEETLIDVVYPNAIIGPIAIPNLLYATGRDSLNNELAELSDTITVLDNPADMPHACHRWH